MPLAETFSQWKIADFTALWIPPHRVAKRLPLTGPKRISVTGPTCGDRPLGKEIRYQAEIL